MVEKSLGQHNHKHTTPQYRGSQESSLTLLAAALLETSKNKKGKIEDVTFWYY